MTGISLRLPATSANLGPGFDTLALALDLWLEVDAEPADRFSIDAAGRAPEVCGALEGNLLLETYRQVWLRYAASPAQPLSLAIRNGIPLGMGCGSSAASRVAGIALAVHFAGLGWDHRRILEEAAALEHHPDNAAACVLGGFAVAGYSADAPPRAQAVSFSPPSTWHALLALPERPLATTASRAVLPEEYTRSAVVKNLQNVALLVAAIASADSALLVSATADQLHQPFRGAVCPLLPRLLPLAGEAGVLSVTLSGAGSGILLLIDGAEAVPDASSRVLQRAAGSGAEEAIAIAELLSCRLCAEPARLF